MPELPEIEALAAHLRSHAVGRPIGRIDVAALMREDYGANYFAAFVIDPDGYRLEAYYDKAG